MNERLSRSAIRVPEQILFAALLRYTENLRFLQGGKSFFLPGIGAEDASGRTGIQRGPHADAQPSWLRKCSSALTLPRSRETSLTPRSLASAALMTVDEFSAKEIVTGDPDVPVPAVPCRVRVKLQAQAFTTRVSVVSLVGHSPTVKTKNGR